MKRLSLLACALLLTCGARDSRRSPTQVPPFIAPSPPSLSHDFIEFLTSTGQCSGSPLSGVDFKRASVGSCSNNARTLVDLGANQPALDAIGLLLEPAAAQGIVNSDDPTTGTWTKTNVTIECGVATAPDGTMTACRVTDDSTNGAHTFYRNLGGGAGPMGITCFLKEDTARYVDLYSGASAKDMAFDLRSCDPCNFATAETYSIRPGPDGWCELSVGSTDAVNAGQLGVRMGTTCSESRGGYVGTGKSILVGRCTGINAQQTRFATSPIRTDGGVITRVAPTATFANPLAGELHEDWCYREEVIPLHHRWDKGLMSGVGQLGEDAGVANTGWVAVDDAGYLKAKVWDTEGDELAWSSGAPLPRFGGELRVCVEDGAINASLGSMRLDGGTSGSGTGAMVMPARGFAGSVGSAHPFFGWVRNGCFGTPANCPVAADNTLATIQLDAGIRSNPFTPLEPVRVVRGQKAGNGEIAGAGDLGSKNSWSVGVDGGFAWAQEVDFQGHFRKRISYGPVADGGLLTYHYVFDQGEVHIAMEDAGYILLQPWVRTEEITDAGHGIQWTAPAHVRASPDVCFSKDRKGCGGAEQDIIIFIGDSLTDAPPGPNGNPNKPIWVKLDQDLPADWEVRSYAIGGTQSNTMRGAQWRLNARELKRVRFGILWSGINDAVTDVPGATAWAQQLDILNEMEARGIRPLLITPTPWGASPLWSEARQTKMDDLMTLQRAWCALTGIQGLPRLCVDANPLFALPLDTVKLNPIYNINSLDGVHLNQAALDIVEGEILDELGL